MTVTDIETEKKMDLLSTIEEMVDMGSFEMDLIGGTWKGSPNFLRIFGLPERPEYDEGEFQEIIHPEDRERVIRNLEKSLSTQKNFHDEYRCVRSDGEILHVTVRSEITYDKQGEPVKIIGVKQDITRRKKLERETSDLTRLIRKKNDVLGMVAHDLRTPLAQIMGLTELLSFETGDDHKETLSMIKQACTSASDIISDLLDFAEAKTRSDIKELRIDLNNLVDQSVEQLRTRLENKKLRIETSLSDDAEILANKTQMLRLIDNLLSNAIKFTPREGTIKIATEQKNGKLLLKVEDTGIGIPEKHIPKLFEEENKEVRRTGTQGERSTGFGLTIVKEIIENHHGEIRVESQVDEGTTFIIALNKQNYPNMAQA